MCKLTRDTIFPFGVLMIFYMLFPEGFALQSIVLFFVVMLKSFPDGFSDNTYKIKAFIKLSMFSMCSDAVLTVIRECLMMTISDNNFVYFGLSFFCYLLSWLLTYFLAKMLIEKCKLINTITLKKIMTIILITIVFSMLHAAEVTLLEPVGKYMDDIPFAFDIFESFFSMYMSGSIFMRMVSIFDFVSLYIYVVLLFSTKPSAKAVTPSEAA